MLDRPTLAVSALFALLCFGLLLPEGVSAFLDPLELELRKQYLAALRWDNIEGSPLLMDGLTPEYDFNSGLHRFSLNPGQSITVRIPRNSLLRTHSGDSFTPTSPLTYMLSQGFGLRAHIQPIPSADGHDLLIKPPDGASHLCTIANPQSATTPAAFSLFVSRREVVTDIAPYREDFPVQEGEVAVSRKGIADDMPFATVNAGAPYILHVEGPTRFRIESKGLYTDGHNSRRRQYTVQAMLDDVLFGTFQYVTTPNEAQMITLDGDYRPVGRSQTGYLDIPEGQHSLQLRSSIPTLVRVSGIQMPDYLIPGLNRPNPAPDKIVQGLSGDQRLPLWSIGKEEIEAVRNNPTKDVTRTERVAWLLARNNAFPDGGLLARDLLARAANGHPAYGDIRGVHAEVSGIATGFRDLLPSTPQPLQQKHRWLASFHYKENTFRGMALPEQLLADNLSGVGNAIFTSLDQDTSLEYRIPGRSAPSRIRLLALYPEKPVRLVMQTDTGHKTRMELLPSPELEGDTLRPSTGTAALALASLRYPDLDSSTLGGPFGASHYPAPLVTAAVIELPLAPDVKRFSLKIEDKGNAEIALKYLGANQFSLGESAYIQNMETVGGSDAAWEIFRDAFTSSTPVKDDEVPFPVAETARQDLANDWTPIIRHLRALEAQFRAGIVDDSVMTGRNGHRPRLHDSFADAERSAKKNMQENMAVMAVEDWAEAARVAPESERGRIQIELARALLSAGEDFLAVSQFKGLFLFSRDKKIVESAYSRLKEFYTVAEISSALLSLHCVRFAMSPSRQHLAELAVSLVENEYAMEGVKLGLMASGVLEGGDSRILWEAALSNKWSRAGQIFSDNNNASLTQGMTLLAANDPMGALPMFEAAGEEGQAYARAIRDGVDIQQRLFSEDLVLRQQAVLDWELWQWNHPGGRKRVSLAPAIIAHGGTMSMKSKTRGTRAMSYVSAPGRPVKARFYGPLAVKVMSRPIHTHSIASEIEGWLELRVDGQLHLTPINGNWPSAGLTFEGTDHSLPGQAVEFEKTFGPGLHEIEISGQDLALGIQLYGYRPNVPISVLPPMTPDNVEAVLAGTAKPDALKLIEASGWKLFEASVIYAAESGDDRCVPNNDLVQRMLDVREPVTVGDTMWTKLNELRERQSAGRTQQPKQYVARISSFRDMPKAIGQIDELRKTGIPMSVVRLRDDSGDEWFVVQSRPFDTRAEAKDCLRKLNENSTQAIVDDMSAELVRERIVAGYRPMDGCPTSVDADSVAVALGRGQLDEALSLTTETTPSDVLTRMTVLVRIAENSPYRLIEIESMAHELANKHPHVVGLKPLLGRISGLTAWQPVNTIQSSAGVRYIPTASWQNESPYLRTRQAMFGPAHEDEVLLQGPNPVVYSMQNLGRESVSLNIGLPSAPHRKPTSAQVAWQIDAGEIQRTELTPERPESTVRLDVPRGQHSLRIWIENPHRNQFVRLRLQDTAGSGHVDASGAYTERRYFVATKTVPVVAAIKGPAWIRVDELMGRRTVSSYRRIGEGWHEIRLLPSQGDEALYRVNSRTVSSESRFAAMPPQSPEYAEMPEPPFELAALPKPTGVRFDDGFALGGQEDGTWEIEAAAIKRRDVGEDTGSKDAEQFFQLGVRHRYYAEDMPAYFKTELLARRHEHGGPTLGLLEDFTYLPRSVPLTFNAYGSLYVQAPKAGDEYWGTGKTEWSAYLRGRVSQKRDFDDKTYHVPSASIFVRALSMGNDSEYKGKELDRDVYTNYKADHKIGLRLGETLYHRPLLDTLLYGGAHVTTNEQMNPLSPDNIGLRTGWSQLFGSIQTDLGYRFTHYLADHDRANSSNRDFVDAKVHWDYWLDNQDRIRLGFKTEYDLELGQPSGGLTFSWFFGDGRGLRDVRPRAEERFHDLKERAVPQERNNAVDYVLGQ